MLYAVKSYEDDMWYRGLVYDFDTKCVKVLYLDYGYKETVEFTRLHSLEGEHCSLPFQAVQVSMILIRTICRCLY